MQKRAKVRAGEIFLPGLLLVVVVLLPRWEQLRRKVGVRIAIAGVNASVEGVLAVALYRPMWTDAVLSVWDGVIAVAGFVALTTGKLPSWVVVGAIAVAGVIARLWQI